MLVFNKSYIQNKITPKHQTRYHTPTQRHKREENSKMVYEFFVCNTAEYAVIVVWSRTEKISEISESSRNARNPSVDASTHSPIIRTIEK